MGIKEVNLMRLAGYKLMPYSITRESCFSCGRDQVEVDVFVNKDSDQKCYDCLIDESNV